MAVEGTELYEPYSVGAPIELMLGVPYGDLVEPYTQGTPELLTGQLNNRFPVPASAQAFLIDLGPLYDPLMSFDYLNSVATGYFAGALAPEGDFMEPALGQIWPRIG